MPRIHRTSNGDVPFTPEEDAAQDVIDAEHHSQEAVNRRATSVANSKAIRDRALTVERIWAVLKDKELVSDADLPRP